MSSSDTIDSDTSTLSYSRSYSRANTAPNDRRDEYKRPHAVDFNIEVDEPQRPRPARTYSHSRRRRRSTNRSKTKEKKRPSTPPRDITAFVAAVMKNAPNVIKVAPRQPIQAQQRMPELPHEAPVDVAADIVADAHPYDTTYDTATKAIKHVALGAVRRLFAKVISKSFENGNTSEPASMVLAREAERQIQGIEKGLNGLIQTHEPNTADPRLVRLHSAYQTQKVIADKLRQRQKQLDNLNRSDTITVQSLQSVRKEIARSTQSLQVIVAEIRDLQEQHASGENILVLKDGSGFGTPAHVAGAISNVHKNGKELLEKAIYRLGMDVDDDTKKKMLQELSVDLDRVVFDVLAKLSH